jgi:hypothetical protein
MILQEENIKQKRTKAQFLRDKVVVRIAMPSAGEYIAELLAENDIELPPMNWSAVSGNWLIATVDDEVMGCVMVLPAKPFGFVEFLVMKPSMSFKLRAIAARKLMVQAAATLAGFGCEALFCYVDESTGKFSDILTKHGHVKVASGSLYMARLI